jgi:hypothetical protein
MFYIRKLLKKNEISYQEQKAKSVSFCGYGGTGWQWISTALFFKLDKITGRIAFGLKKLLV